MSHIAYAALIGLICAEPVAAPATAQPKRLCVQSETDPARLSNPACPPVLDAVVIQGRIYTRSMIPPTELERKYNADRDEKRVWIAYRDCNLGWEACKEKYPGLRAMLGRYFDGD